MDTSPIGWLAAEAMEALGEDFDDEATVKSAVLIIELDAKDREYHLWWRTKGTRGLRRMLTAGKRLADAEPPASDPPSGGTL